MRKLKRYPDVAEGARREHLRRGVRVPQDESVPAWLWELWERL